VALNGARTPEGSQLKVIANLLQLGSLTATLHQHRRRETLPAPTEIKCKEMEQPANDSWCCIFKAAKSADIY
jgi:hypothetical protein